MVVFMKQFQQHQDSEQDNFGIFRHRLAPIQVSFPKLP